MTADEVVERIARAWMEWDPGADDRPEAEVRHMVTLLVSELGVTREMVAGVTPCRDDKQCPDCPDGSAARALSLLLDIAETDDG